MTSMDAMRTTLVVAMLFAALTTMGLAPDRSAPPPDAFEVTVPGCALNMVFVRVPTKAGEDPRWVSQTEVTWDAYDAMVYRLDQEDPAAEPTDGLTRPTKPYIMADRGWGHAGFPALSVSHNGAKAFCVWLGAKVKGSFRLLTVREWTALAKGSGITPDNLDEHCWHKKTSKRRKTQAVGTKKADANNLHDLFGNVSEWCLVDGTQGDEMVLMGGHFKQNPENQTADERKEPTPAWNDTDPQIPKSIWWLSDAPFAGFRVACTRPPAGAKLIQLNKGETP